MEIWKDIKGYEGLYQVSNIGRVRSVDRYVNHIGCKVIRKGKILRPATDTSGYHGVILSKNNIAKRYKVSRLVASAFIPNPQNKEQVNHIDGNKLNNNVVNLEWCTASENIEHAYKNGLLIIPSGSNDKRSIRVNQIDKNTGAIIATYAGLREAERITGIRHGNIWCCCQGRYKHKTAGGYKWEYAQ